MPAIGLRRAISERLHRVTLQAPGPALPDGDGGYTQTWSDLNPPQLYMSIEPLAADVERTQSETTLSVLTHLVRGPYHPQVTTQTRLLFVERFYGGQRTRILEVAGAATRDERSGEMVLTCNEHAGSTREARGCEDVIAADEVVTVPPSDPVVACFSVPEATL